MKANVTKTPAQNLAARVTSHLKAASKAGNVALVLFSDTLAHGIETGDTTLLARLVAGSEAPVAKAMRALFARCAVGQIKTDPKQPCGLKVQIKVADTMASNTMGRDRATVATLGQDGKTILGKDVKEFLTGEKDKPEPKPLAERIGNALAKELKAGTDKATLAAMLRDLAGKLEAEPAH